MQFICPSRFKDILIDQIINLSKFYPYLEGISRSNSDNEDFELNNYYRKSLTFIEKGNTIIGLKSNDKINYWTRIEMENLNELIKIVLFQILNR